MKKLCLFTLSVIVSLICVHTAKGLDLKALQEELHRRGDPWIAGETELSKLSLEEKRQLCGCLPSTESEWIGIPDLETVKRPPLKKTLPTEMDWRNYNGANWMTSVKYQCKCGACWAFAWVSAQEARMKIKRQNPTWKKADLSEQFVLSCNPLGYDCSGGKMLLGNWIKQDGIPDEACYPYKDSLRSAGRSQCSGRCGDWESRAELGKITNWGTISSSVSASVLKDEIMRGPVTMIVNMKEDFFYYKGGDYEPIMGENVGYHAICVCGWNSNDAWLCKNSWKDSLPYFFWNTSWMPMQGAWMDPNVKPDTGTPIIWTTNSLDFVFHQEGKSSPNISFSSGEVILESSLLLSLIEGTKAGEDTLYYDDGTLSWAQQGENNALYWAVRFTPTQPCIVKAGLVETYTFAGTPPSNCSLFVWDDNGGTPSNLSAGPFAFATGGTGAWERVNVTTFCVDNDDFWLGYWLPWYDNPGPGDTTKVLTDDSKNYGSRQGLSANRTEWHVNTAEIGGDLMIRAIITYEGYAGSGTILVKNAGAGKLTASNVHSAGSPGWIVGVSPTSFDIYSDDSAGIEVGIDTSGLQIDVPYQDEIIITSNSNNITTETRVPVTLIIKSGGVAEEKVSTLTMFKLSPNPFGDKVSLSYFVPEKTNVKLVVRDITGREVAEIVNKIENTGIKKIEWNTKDIPSGVYFCRLAIGDSDITRKVLLIR